MATAICGRNETLFLLQYIPTLYFSSALTWLKNIHGSREIDINAMGFGFHSLH